jgi:CBS domain-containing protein
MVSNSEAAGRIDKLRVKDIMIPLAQYPKVSAQCTLRTAMKVLHEAQLDVRGRKSLPRVILVLDDEDRLVGVCRRRDILRGLEPKSLLTQPLEYRKKLFNVAADPHLSTLLRGHWSEGIIDQANRPVSDVMQRVDAGVDGDDNIMSAGYEMVSKDKAILPVIGDGRVVGVVRSADVFRELAALIL